MHVWVVGVVVVNSDPLQPRPQVGFHRSHQSANVLFEVHPVGVLGRYDESPHELITVLLPLPDPRYQIDVAALHVEPPALFVLKLRPFAREVAGVRDPRTWLGLAVARVHRLDHTAPLRRPCLRSHPTAAPIHRLAPQRGHSPFNAHPPRHQRLRPFGPAIPPEPDIHLFSVELWLSGHLAKPPPTAASEPAQGPPCLSAPPLQPPQSHPPFPLCSLSTPAPPPAS